ncbi:MAG: PilZ domain-containing protein [Bacillota bacterium]|nr:PilZ domain-containing protein [Bacillota bacterium]
MFDLENENILKNSKILTRHIDDNDWVSSKVLNCYKSYIEIDLVEKYLEKLLLLEDNLSCKMVKNSNSIFLIDARVHNIKLESRSIALEINQYKIIKNTRKHHRYDVRLYSSFIRNNGKREIYSLITNISRSGFNLTTNEDLEIGEIIDLNVYFRSFDTVSVKCEVKWKSKNSRSGYSLGVKIISMNEYDRLRFDEFMEQIEMDHSILL